MSRCCRIPGSNKSQSTPSTAAPGKAGSVLVVEFTLAGQRFMALNGGKAFDFTHAISFKVDCADQAEVDAIREMRLPRAVRSNNAAG